MKRLRLGLLGVWAGVSLAAQAETVVDREELTTQMDDVFNQGRTNWCWAYAAYHTIRTHYFSVEEPNEITEAWRDEIERLNDPDDFRRYLFRHSNPGNFGHPAHFITLIRRYAEDGPLPEQSWKIYYPSGRTVNWEQYGLDPSKVHVQGISLQQAKQMIYRNLKSNTPSVWCGIGHCTTLYGGTFEGGQAVTYQVADSATDPATYDDDAWKLERYMDIILTLEPQS